MKGIIRFLVRMLVLNVVLVPIMVLGPLLYVIPFFCIVANPREDFSGLAQLYFWLGPLSCAFWMLISCHWPRNWHRDRRSSVFGEPSPSMTDMRSFHRFPDRSIDEADIAARTPVLADCILAAGTRYSFPDLRTLLARATPFRSGDALAGVAAARARGVKLGRPRKRLRPHERLAAADPRGRCAALCRG